MYSTRVDKAGTPHAGSLSTLEKTRGFGMTPYDERARLPQC
jgi:hypothetical protein